MVPHKCIVLECPGKEWADLHCTDDKWSRERVTPDKSEIFWHLLFVVRLKVQLFAELKSGCTWKTASPQHPKDFFKWGEWDSFPQSSLNWNR